MALIVTAGGGRSSKEFRIQNGALAFTRHHGPIGKLAADPCRKSPRLLNQAKQLNCDDTSCLSVFLSFCLIHTDKHKTKSKTVTGDDASV